MSQARSGPTSLSSSLFELYSRIKSRNSSQLGLDVDAFGCSDSFDAAVVAVEGVAVVVAIAAAVVAVTAAIAHDSELLLTPA